MILVFAKTGQVAKELQKYKNIFALDRTQANLMKPYMCSEAIVTYKPLAVINAAAYTSVDKAEYEEDVATQINSIAPVEMAKTCAKLNIPFVHISTDYVFDGKGNSSWKSSDATNPVNAYGRTKLKGEEGIISSGAIYVILRTSWIISSHGSNFLKTMLQLSKSRQKLNVVSDQFGGPTPARDIARACKLIAQELINNPHKKGIYHLSGTPNVNWCEFANIIFKEAGLKTIANPVLTTEYPTLSRRPYNSRLNCSSTLKNFNIFRPRWRDSLKLILKEFELENETS